MFEILGGALKSILGGKTPQGESQILEMIGEIFKGKDEKQRAFLLEKMQKEFDRAKMEFADTENARQMQIAALGQNDRFSKRFVYYLSGVVILIIFVALGGLFYFDIPQENRSLVDRIVDIFQNYGTIVLGFYFGQKFNKKKNV